jgi:hypothetical protein
MMGIIWAATLVGYGVHRLATHHPAGGVTRPEAGRVITLPDNTTFVLPDGFNMKKFLCEKDNTFCFDNNATSEFRRKRQGDGYFYLWRI